MNVNSSPYPYNKTEHIFDFKVKVNFENGNVSLSAPQIVNPPAFFNTMQNQLQINQNNRNMNIQYNQNNNIQMNRVNEKIKLVNPENVNVYKQQKLIVPSYHRNQLQNININSNTNNINNMSHINSNSNHSYKQHQFSINDSIEVIQCVICQKTFNMNEFDSHLQFHKQRRIQQNFHPICQKNKKDYSSNGIMVTQNSFNNANDSYISSNSHNSQHNKSEYSFKHNESNLSHKSSQGNLINIKSMNSPNSQQRPVTSVIMINQNNQSIRNKQIHNQNNPNQSSHFLGQIQNPILLLKANQNQQSFTNSHHHNNSLDYSNSSQNIIQPRFDQPNNKIINPLIMQNNQSNSFGNHQFIGPAFNNSNSSLSLDRNFVNVSNQQHNRVISNIQEINNGIHVNSFNNFNNNNNSLQHQHYPHQQNSINIGPIYHNNNSNNSMYSQSSNPVHHYPSSNSSYNNRSFPQNNFLLQHFQPIQSRCTIQHQPLILRHSNANQDQNVNNNNFNNSNNNMHGLNNVSIMSHNLYSSYNDKPVIQKNIKGTKSHHNQPFFHDDSLSSISNTSRISMTQYSDFQQINKNINHINQEHQRQINKQKNYQQNNQNNQNNYQYNSTNNNNTKMKPSQSKVGFFKKKKDHMISSTASYYDQKFNNNNQSSSEDENEYNHKNQRLSYADRLKQKKLTDSNQNTENCQCKSLSMTKNLKKQTKMTSSKISQMSSQSKTKLPVNYLARQDFISTSSKTSKSTHKSTVKDN